MMTWFGPSEKYVELERTDQNTEIITDYCIAEKSIDE